MYHGGIRPEQTENIILQVNQFSRLIPSKTGYMRDPEEITLDIPMEHISLDGGNVLFLYVLPWIEEYPILKIKGKILRPAHFRDIGVTLLQIKIEENV